MKTSVMLLLLLASLTAGGSVRQPKQRRETSAAAPVSKETPSFLARAQQRIVSTGSLKNLAMNMLLWIAYLVDENSVLDRLMDCDCDCDDYEDDYKE